MKIFVIGSRGQLGRDLVSLLVKNGHAVTGNDIPEIDIADYRSTLTRIREYAPDVIINCAAYTAVDACETHRQEAFAVNSIGAENIAQSALETGSRVIHISTDYVFDGTKNEPYVENDIPHPTSAYGQSKLEGEVRLASILPNHLIVRVSWLYGIHGQHFIKKIVAKAKSLAGTVTPLTVVTDEVGTPTYTIDVCNQIMKLLQTEHTGIFHCTNEGSCSRYDFAGKILAAYHLNTPVVPCTSRDFVLPAPRPAYSVLENKRLKELGINVMRDWEDAFADYLLEEAQAS